MKTFKISDQCEAKIKEWQETHECSCRTKDGYRYVGAVGGADSFTFVPTSIGMALTVKCACGSELHLNNF